MEVVLLRVADFYEGCGAAGTISDAKLSIRKILQPLKLR